MVKHVHRGAFSKKKKKIGIRQKPVNLNWLDPDPKLLFWPLGMIKDITLLGRFDRSRFPQVSRCQRICRRADLYPRRAHTKSADFQLRRCRLRFLADFTGKIGWFAGFFADAIVQQLNLWCGISRSDSTRKISRAASFGVDIVAKLIVAA